MSLTSRITIIDCGASRTALGVFSLKQGRLACLDYAVENFQVRHAGEDQWLANTTAAFQSLGRAPGRTGPAVLVLPGHLTLTKQFKTPGVDPGKREKIVRFEAGQYIPYPLNEVVWDSVVSGKDTADQDVMLVAAKRDVVEQLCAAARAARFSPRRVLPVALTALAGLRLAEPAPAEPLLAVNMGARTTTLLLLEREHFAARTISLGGNNVTQLIAENQDCDISAAEKLKLSGSNQGLLVDAVESVTVRLAQEITRSVLHFRRESKFGNPTRLALTGGGVELAGLEQLLADKLRLPARQIDLKHRMEASAGATTADRPISIDVVGAAAIELLPGQANMNLLPVSSRQRESLRRRRPWLVATAVLLLLVLIPPILHHRQLAAAAHAKTLEIDREITPLRVRESRMRANREQLAKLEVQVRELQSLHHRRAAWLRLFAGLQERLVKMEDVWLENLQTIPPVGDAPMKLMISGRMLDKTNPLAKVSPEIFARVNTLFTSAAGLPFVSGIEGERFDNSQPGILKFDFVLLVDPANPL